MAEPAIRERGVLGSSAIHTGLAVAPGMASNVRNLFPGQGTFRGPIFHTSRWPKEPVELGGKRVGVIGIRATGVQVIQTIADKVEHLTVFARTPQYALPMKNPKYSPEDQAAYHARFEEIRETIPRTFTGSHLRPDELRDLAVDLLGEEHLSEAGQPPLERAVLVAVLLRLRARLGRLHPGEEAGDPGLKNKQHLIDILVPTDDDYGFGTHRVPLERNYYEVYHRDNVELVGSTEQQDHRDRSRGHQPMPPSTSWT